jgi:protoheme IX farnesyltransferase
VKINSVRSTIAVYADLIKYKLSLAVTFSSVTGYFIFSHSFNGSLLSLVIGVFLLASGSAALNQYTEREFDVLMDRTRNRPLPLKKINHEVALKASISLLATGFIFTLFTGILPSLLGFLNLVLYNLAYTRLKRITPLAIIPGALVGAVPPFIGYAGAGGMHLKPEIILFSAFMFLWQLPHFWLIIIRHKDEYKSAGFKTFSHTMTEQQIKILIFLWVFFSTLFLLCFSSLTLDLSKPMNYFLILLNSFFILLFYKLLFRRDTQNDVKSAFILINSFSFLIMILFIVNSFLS